MAKITWKKQADIDLEREHEETLRVHEEKRVEAQKKLLDMVVGQYLLSKDLTDEHKQKFTSLYPLWEPDQELSVGDKVVYEGNVYEVIQEHTSQSDWLPNLVPALYKIFYQRVAEDEGGDEVDVIPVWVQPLGAHDAYNAWDLVYYDGKVWESKSDGNVWIPGVHGWEEIPT